MKIVEVIKTTLKKGIKYLLVEVLKDDLQEHVFFSVPGYESSPLSGEKVFKIKTDKHGKSVLMGVPLETNIDDGEVCINGRSSSGDVIGKVYLKSNGDIELGLNNFQGVVLANFKDIFNAHGHPDTNTPPSVLMTNLNISSKVKVQ